MPEECPLQTFTPLAVVFESKLVFLVNVFEEVEHFCRRFHDGEGWLAGVVHEHRNAT